MHIDASDSQLVDSVETEIPNSSLERMEILMKNLVTVSQTHYRDIKKIMARLDRSDSESESASPIRPSPKSYKRKSAKSGANFSKKFHSRDICHQPQTQTSSGESTVKSLSKVKFLIRAPKSGSLLTVVSQIVSHMCLLWWTNCWSQTLKVTNI